MVARPRRRRWTSSPRGRKPWQCPTIRERCRKTMNGTRVAIAAACKRTREKEETGLGRCLHSCGVVHVSTVKRLHVQRVFCMCLDDKWVCSAVVFHACITNRNKTVPRLNLNSRFSCQMARPMHQPSSSRSFLPVNRSIDDDDDGCAMPKSGGGVGVGWHGDGEVHSW